MMTEKEAFQIIEFVRNIYEMKFTEQKLNIWLKFLQENGDYQPTLKKAKQYVNDGNPYAPKLPNIIKREPKMLKEESVDDETKQHRWRMQNDDQYRQKRQQALEAFKQKVSEFGGDDNA